MRFQPATNSETGARYETVAMGNGNYTFLSLPAGPYDLIISASPAC
jgi:hypothetical protein